jgi:hypothetical protein
MKYGWSKMLEKESNRSQAITRIKSLSNRMLNDLLLLAEQVPEEEIELFIPREMIAALTRMLLRQRLKDVTKIPDPTTVSKPSASRVQLAYLLNEISVQSLISEYKLLFNNTPELANVVTEHIQKATSISRDIVYLIELNEGIALAEKKNLGYLFKWEELPGKDVVRLLDYLELEFGQTYFAKKIEKNGNGKVLTFSTQIMEGDIVSGKIKLMDEDKKGGYRRAIMTFDDNPIKDRREFIVMNDNNGTYLFKSRRQT